MWKAWKRFTRKQIPFEIAYTITILKSRGLKLEMIVKDSGVCQFLTYVVLIKMKKLILSVFTTHSNENGFDKIGLSKVSKLKTLQLVNGTT